MRFVRKLLALLDQIGRVQTIWALLVAGPTMSAIAGILAWLRAGPPDVIFVSALGAFVLGAFLPSAIRQLAAFASPAQTRAGQSTSALRPTKKGVAELLQQEVTATGALRQSRGQIVDTLKRISEQAAKPHGDMQRRVTALASSNDPKAKELYQQSFPLYAKNVKQFLPELRQRVQTFERASEQLIECWSGYVEHAKKPRHGKRPSYENRRESVGAYIDETAIQSVCALRDEILRSSHGYNQTLDRVLEDEVAPVNRFIMSMRLTQNAAKEMLRYMDRWLGFVGRLKLRIATKKTKP